MKTAPNRALWPLLAALCLLTALMLWLPRRPVTVSESTGEPKTTKRVKFTSEKPKPLPEIDVRPKSGPSSSPSADRAEAFAELKREKPMLQAQFDEISGAPSYLQETGKFLTGKNPGKSAKEAVKDYVSQFPGLFGHDGAALDKARVTREDVTAHNGMTTLVWQQQHAGIPLYNTIFKANVTQDGEVITVSDHFLPDTTTAAQGQGVVPLLTAEQAISIVANSVGDQVAVVDITPQDVPVGTELTQVFTAEKLSDISARLTWMPLAAENMNLGWDVILFSLSRNEMYRAVVDAQNGDLLSRRSLTVDISNATYRVYADPVTKQPYDSPKPFSPGHSTPSSTQPAEVPRQLLTMTGLTATASPAGWVPDGGTQTLGNNVDAHLDINADNAPDLPRPTSPTRNFDFTMDTTQAPTTYRDAAVTQLFYFNNWTHDRMHQLGFTESAGNFQTDNFGRGGLGNDAVQADAQDGSGTNNANFSTPPDGWPGRMQMYIFPSPTPDVDGDFDGEIVIHEYTHGLSNRLVGGGVGMDFLQSTGMGEGWSDFYALCLLAQPGDDPDAVYAAGGYATKDFFGLTENYYYGIRRYPYSTDMAKNPLTFKDIDPTKASAHTGVPLSPISSPPNVSSDEVHNQGEVWCATLWEVRRNLVVKHGFATGNELTLRLVTDGMKLAPVNPTFIQARDAVLQADVVMNGGANLNEMWAGFAKRGMGFSASGPVSTTTIGVFEAFDTPTNLYVGPLGALDVTAVRLTGPITPLPATLTLVNLGTTPISWTASKTQSWLSLSATSGTLAGGASTTLNGYVQSSALSMAAGDYTDTISIQNVMHGATLTRQVRLTVEPYLTRLAAFDLDSDPQWSRNGQWAFGTPTGSRVSTGDYPADPTSGYTGANVFGISLNGVFALTAGPAEYLTSPAFNLTGTSGNYVSFKRYLNSWEEPWGIQTVEMSTDGVNWNVLWRNGSLSVNDGSWKSIRLPLGAAADNQATVYLRWGHQVSNPSAPARTGWNLDDIEILTSSALTTILAYTQNLSTGHNTPVNVILTGSNSAAPAAPKTFTITGNPAHGTLSGTAPNLTYTPDTGFYGMDSFSFTMTSGGVTSAAAAVNVAVGSGAADIAVATMEGAALSDGGSFTMGSVAAGSQMTRRLILTNTGTGPLTLGTPALTGLNSADFALGTLSATRLEAGQSARLDVAFRPLNVNTRTALLQIANNDPDEGPFDITLVGTATGFTSGVMLAEDINLTANGLAITPPVTIGSTTYFGGTTIENGLEIWKTDGTSAGTVMVRDFATGTGSGLVGNLTNFGGVLYFSGAPGGVGTELYKTDGTSAGTVIVKDINSGTASSSPANFTPAGAIMYFSATDATNGTELWKTDGTLAGTVLVANINPGTANSSPANFRMVGSTLYFSATTAANGTELWKSDGTAGGTVLVADITPGTANTTLANFNELGSLLIFSATDATNGTELWVSDGTSGGTVLLKDINPGTASSTPQRFVKLGTKLFFNAATAAEAAELWSTDGTAAGTQLFLDINPGTGSANPNVITLVGDKFYFTAFDANGREPWISDGTVAGTYMVKDIAPGSGTSVPLNFTAVGSSVFFSASVAGDGTGNYELFKTDGTEAGTVFVKDINAGTGSSAATNFAALGSLLIFSATDGINGQEPWRSDGTEAGTYMLQNGQPGTNTASIANLRNVNGALYFTANDGNSGSELWRSADGTPANTALHTNINTAAATGSNPVNLTTLGTALFLSATGSSGTELYRSNAGAAATLVKDINVGTGSSTPSNFGTVGSTLVYFSATDTTANGAELWKSDGTSVGTVLVKNINTLASTGSNVANITDLNGTTFFFTANDGVNGTELWMSDGTDPGTVLVRDINAGSASSSPANLRVVGSILFFTATTAANGTELWKSDGTSAGTVLVSEIAAGTASSSPANLTVMGTNVFFSASNGTTTGLNGTELWMTDGTTTTMVKDISAGTGSSSPNNLLAIGSTLYFAATTTAEGGELWKSDGTSAGTVLVANIGAGNASSTPQSLTDVGSGVFYFTALNGTNGRELWKSDGTTLGTVLAADIVPGTTSSSPANLTLSGNLLYFTATVSALGTSELFALDVRPFEDIAVEQGGSSLVSGVSSVNFGTVAAGSTAIRSFAVRNTGVQPLIVSGLTLSGAGAANFATSSISTATLTPGSATPFTVTFTAGATGAVTATLNVESTDPDENPFSITLTANATAAPEIALEQPAGTPRLDGSGTIAFGDSPIGTPVTRTITLKNNGTLNLNVSSFSITGAQSTDYSTTGSAGSVPAGSSTSFDVTFTPTGFGARSAYLEVASDDTDEPLYRVYLTGVCPHASGGPLRLARDIFNTGASVGTFPPVVAMGGSTYFAWTDGRNGTELWKSDGTPAGTVMVRDIAIGSASSSPANLRVIGSTLYFSASDGIVGTELWKTDGTPGGTVLVKDINTPGTSSSNPSSLVEFVGLLFFAATDAAGGTELWLSDGTLAGTVRAADVVAGSTGSSPGNLTAVGTTLFFSALTSQGTELWKYEAGAASLVRDINAGAGSSMTTAAFTRVLGSKLIFQATDGLTGLEYWVSDGTSAGTVLLADINPGTNGSVVTQPTHVVSGSVMFFPATRTADGQELWKTDGTPAGTVLVRDINPGTASSSPSSMLASPTGVYFSATEGVNGIELWHSDGTSAGTVLVADISPGVTSSQPSSLTFAGSNFYFTATTSATGRELWKSDGTAAGTSLVMDINVGTTSSSIALPTDIGGGKATFFVADASNGTELWVTDGTAAGTRLPADVTPGTAGASITAVQALNGRLIFNATDILSGAELWSSNGQPGDTSILKEIATGTTPSNPANFSLFGGMLYFSAADTSNGTELWKTDGTNAGTVMVKNINAGSSASSPTVLTDVGGTLFFSATETATLGAELYKSDGTSAGTTLVKDINTIAASGSSITGITNVNGTAFFSANDGVNGAELWKSDGTSAGTVLVKDINPGISNSTPSNLRAIGSTLYFTATTAANGTELWKSDGTSAGTVLVMEIAAGTANSSPANLTVIGSTLYFSASNGTTTGLNGNELWKTDGTTTSMVKDILVGTGSSSPANFAAIGNVLYFSANGTSTQGTELWKSDGTSAGTVLVRDIQAGTGSSSPAVLTNIHGTLYFTALTTAEGRELWKSDGTSAGTVLVADIWPGTSSSAPTIMTAIDQTLFIVANGPDTGTELWIYDLAIPEISIEQPVNVALTDGVSSIHLGEAVRNAGSTSLVFTLRNTGSAALTGLVPLIDGPHAAEFAISGLPSSVSVGSSGTFTITFTPTGLGTRSAALHLANNDPSETPFDIALTGTGGYTAAEAWRLANFGSIDNTGAGADTANTDGDGLNNLMEFAFGLNPNASDSGVLVLDGTTLTQRGTQTPRVITQGTSTSYQAAFCRNLDAVAAGYTYTVQFSADLATWFNSSATPTVQATDGNVQAVTVPYPFLLPNRQKARFFRVTVTPPP